MSPPRSQEALEAFRPGLHSTPKHLSSGVLAVVTSGEFNSLLQKQKKEFEEFVIEKYEAEMKELEDWCAQFQ